EPLPPSIDQQAGQQARLGGFSPAPMVARIGCELVANSGPALIVDQSRLLSGVEFTLVSYVAGVNWVREQCVEMTAREGFAAALGAIRCRAAFRPKPETVGFLLDPTHAAELTIESEDAAYRLGLGRVDDERALVGVIAQRHIAAHPHALFLRGGDLVADAFTGDLPLELGKGQQHIERNAPLGSNALKSLSVGGHGWKILFIVCSGHCSALDGPPAS